MRIQKVLACLALGLAVAQVLVVLASWVLMAAMPDVFTRSLTNAEGIRWFCGNFTDMLATPWLVWIVLASFAAGMVGQCGVLRYDSSEYRQRTALRLILVEFLMAVLLMLALTVVPHAILLNVLGGLLPSSFTRSLVPYVCLVLIFMGASYGWMSERFRSVTDIYVAMNSGFRLLSPLFLFYVLLMQLYRSIMYLV